MSDYYLKPTSPIKTTVDSYYYEFDKFNDPLGGSKEYWLIIIFENGKFDRISVNESCKFDMLDAKGMKLIDLINQEIKRLEGTYQRS